MCVTVAKTRLLTPSLAECELQVDPHGVLPVSKRQHIGHVNKFAQAFCRVVAFFFVSAGLSVKQEETWTRKSSVAAGGGRWKKVSFLPHHHDKVQGRSFECQIPWMFYGGTEASHFSFLKAEWFIAASPTCFFLSSLFVDHTSRNLELGESSKQNKSHREEHGNFQSYTDDRSITRDFHTDPDFGYKTKPESLTIFSFIFRLTRSWLCWLIFRGIIDFCSR